MKKKLRFALVHGAGHGAWCWYKLAALLESAGHEVTAVDLAACGGDSRRLDEVRSVHDYVQPLMVAMAALPENDRVVLVGHSLGGVAISLAAEAFPEKVAAAVYAAAFVAAPGSALGEVMLESFRTNTSVSMLDSEYSLDDGPESPTTTIKFGPKLMSTKLYQLCSLEDKKLAVMLVRPSKLFVAELLDKNMITEERYGSVARIYIKCKQDDILKVDFQEWMIERAMVEEVMEVDSDHMVMLSKPLELFGCLLKITEKYF